MHTSVARSLARPVAAPSGSFARRRDPRKVWYSSSSKCKEHEGHERAKIKDGTTRCPDSRVIFMRRRKKVFVVLPFRLFSCRTSSSRSPRPAADVCFSFDFQLLEGPRIYWYLQVLPWRTVKITADYHIQATYQITADPYNQQNRVRKRVYDCYDFQDYCCLLALRDENRVLQA